MILSTVDCRIESAELLSSMGGMVYWGSVEAGDESERRRNTVEFERLSGQHEPTQLSRSRAEMVILRWVVGARCSNQIILRISIIQFTYKFLRFCMLPAISMGLELDLLRLEKTLLPHYDVPQWEQRYLFIKD